MAVQESSCMRYKLWMQKAKWISIKLLESILIFIILVKWISGFSRFTLESYWDGYGSDISWK